MPSPWLAVGAETDPLRRARQLQRSWERLLAEGALGSELPSQAMAGLRSTIVESWRRSLATGLEPTELLVPIVADQSEVRERWLEHPLGSLEHVIAAQLRGIAEESQSLVVVSDASGLLLHIDGAEWLKERAREMNFLEGARLSEAVDGTNGIGTPLAADHALQVFAFEHFNQRHHQWICSGAPVHDPLSGRIVGLIDLSSLWKIAHPRSLELVITAARTMEQCLLDTRRDQHARLRRRYSDFMRRSTDLLVDRDGYVLDGHGRKRPAPLDVPEGGGEIVLDDGSVAMAEPLGQGEAYLVRRPRSRGAKSAPVEALKRAEMRAHELAIEQAALRQVATLVARGSSPGQLFAVLAKQVARVFDVPLVRLVRFEPDCAVVVAEFSEGSDDPFPIGSRWPLDSPGVIASVHESSRPARVQDYAHMPGRTAAAVRRSGMRSAVASPVVVEGRLWGAMVIASPRREPLPKDTEPSLTDFTELVATAIANAESRAAVSQLAEEQAALRRVATLVAKAAGPGEVFLAVAQEVARVFGVEQVTVCRYESGEVVVLSFVGVPSFSAGSRWSLGVPSLPGSVYQTLSPVRIDDFSDASGLDAIARDVGGVKAAVGVPIVVDGTVWGSINISSTEGGRFQADAEERLSRFTDLVATSVSNATMRAELAASRARIVAAADEERRRVVRDLHDGAQQRLVHTIVTLNLAQCAQDNKDDEKAWALIREARQNVEQANAELRDLAHGILPSVLTRGGLGAAVRALAIRTSVPIEIDIAVGRFPAAVEATAYFIVAEALTNVAKHSHAQRAEVTARIRNGVLEIQIRDDGVGGARPNGSGLVGLRDRVEALGGTMIIDSPEGGGTTLEAELPLDDAVAAAPDRPV
jgi:signal transduction histidine kinase